MWSRLVGSWRVLLPVVSFALIGLCWVVSTPPSAGVDEGSHFARALGIAGGSLIGDDVPADHFVSDSMTAAQVARVNAESGFVEVRAPLSVPIACNVLDAQRPYDCGPIEPTTGTTVDISFHAHSLPGAYFLPALATLAGSTTWRAIVLARLAFLLQNLVLMAVAALALRRLVPRPSTAALASIALSITPLLAYQSGTMSPNGTEIWASIAFLGALLAALTLRSSRWWWTAAVVGTFACWSRDLGMPDVVAFGAAALLVAPGSARWLWSRRRSVDAVAGVALVLAALGSLAWQSALKARVDPVFGSPAQWWSDFGTTMQALWDSIGLVGWLNVPIDPAINALWAMAWIAGVTVLFIRAERRTRLVVVAMAVFYVVLSDVLIAGFRPTGFALQARHTMAIPIAAVVVLVAGRRTTPADRAQSWHRLGRIRWALAGACVLVALGNLSALLLSAQHNATGITGAAMRFTDVVWSPPGGWPLVLGLFAVACGSIVLLPIAALRPAALDTFTVDDPAVDHSAVREPAR